MKPIHAYARSLLFSSLLTGIIAIFSSVQAETVQGFASGTLSNVAIPEGIAGLPVGSATGDPVSINWQYNTNQANLLILSENWSSYSFDSADAFFSVSVQDSTWTTHRFIVDVANNYEVQPGEFMDAITFSSSTDILSIAYDGYDMAELFPGANLTGASFMSITSQDMLSNTDLPMSSDEMNFTGFMSSTVVFGSGRNGVDGDQWSWAFSYNVDPNSIVMNTVSPVPEMETWAMMMAGLGFVGWRVRKAQAQALA